MKIVYREAQHRVGDQSDRVCDKMQEAPGNVAGFTGSGPCVGGRAALLALARLAWFGALATIAWNRTCLAIPK